ncbi:MAG: TetR/AcrR family transcriptional regulator [Nocardioides sp.]
MNLAAKLGRRRPRVEGDRELEILLATLRILADVGYDRLTMDAVAAEAKASKATLYRRWNTKLSLVLDALKHTKGSTQVPDTGTLRGDLEAAYCGMGGIADPETVEIATAIVTAVGTDPDFAVAFRKEVLGPKIATSVAIWERAQARGEVAADVDLTLIEPALAGIILHRTFVLGEMPDAQLISRVIDQIILPAATRPAGPVEHGDPTTARNPKGRL